MSELSRVEDLLVTGVEEPVEPMSRMEAILRGENVKPQSRIEQDLLNYNPGGGTLITKSIDTNGTYNANADEADGYSSVTVAVPPTPLDNLNATANGEYNPTTGRGFGKVTVAVPASSVWIDNDNTKTLTSQVKADGDVRLYFNGMSLSGVDSIANMPLKIRQYLFTNGNDVIYTKAYDSDKETQIGWVGLYQNSIRLWSIDLSTNISGDAWGCLDIYGEQQQENAYVEPSYN